MIKGLRDRIKEISPSWLRRGVAERVLYNFGLGMDAVLEKLTQGVKARMPGRGDPSALPLLGSDRRIRRGITEGDESFAFRLQHAFGGWQRAGTARAVMRELLGFLLAFTPEMRSVSQRSIWETFGQDADTDYEPERLIASPANWDWDSLDALSGAALQLRWWRRWLVIYATAPQNWTDVAPFVWGTPGIKWGATSNSWGLSASPNVGIDLRGITDERKSANTHYLWFIVSFDDALFDPALPSGGGVNPDGLFGRWDKIVDAGPGLGLQYVPSRFANARYISGVI